MGTGALRLGDMFDEHTPPKYFPHAIIVASTDVLVNGLGSARLGDDLATHVPKQGSPHSFPKIASGSSTVFVNGKPKARLGDTSSCGSKSLTASSDVIVG